MKVWLAVLGIVLLSLSTAATAFAAVITVNTGSDPIDIDWQTATIADLPGPDGKVSFSEAMIAANNTPGHDRIEFAIPQLEWQMQWLYPGFPVISSSYTFLKRALWSNSGAFWRSLRSSFFETLRYRWRNSD